VTVKVETPRARVPIPTATNRPVGDLGSGLGSGSDGEGVEGAPG